MIPRTRSHRRLMLLVPAALLLLGLSGCGGSDPAPPAPDPEPAPTDAAVPAAEVTPTAAAAPPAIDPCALVTQAEAEELAGTPLQEPMVSPDSCVYTAPVDGPTAQVEVFVGDGAKKILDIDRELGHDLQPIDAGDEAFIEDGAVFVSRNGVWVAVRLVRLEDPAVFRSAMEDVARTVAGRL